MFASVLHWAISVPATLGKDVLFRGAVGSVAGAVVTVVKCSQFIGSNRAFLSGW